MAISTLLNEAHSREIVAGAGVEGIPDRFAHEALRKVRRGR